MIDHFTKYAEHVDSKTWMSKDIPKGQWDSLRRRTHQGAHETFSSSSGSFYDVTSTNERLGGKTNTDSGVDAEGVMFPIHD